MAENPLTEESDIDMSWDVNKELSVVISCIKNVLWIKDQQDFGNKCLIRELLQKCSGGQIIEMLKNILSREEKTALVKDEFNSLFQAQTLKDVKIKSEVILPDLENKTEYVDERETIENSSVHESYVEGYTSYNQLNQNIELENMTYSNKSDSDEAGLLEETQKLTELKNLPLKIKTETSHNHEEIADFQLDHQLNEKVELEDLIIPNQPNFHETHEEISNLVSLDSSPAHTFDHTKSQYILYTI